MVRLSYECGKVGLLVASHHPSSPPAADSPQTQGDVFLHLYVNLESRKVIRSQVIPTFIMSGIRIRDDFPQTGFNSQDGETLLRWV